MNIFFGLGSNLENRLQNLRSALRRLEQFGSLIKSSDVFETEAWGGVPQPHYLNACVKIQCPSHYVPHDILSAVKNFEREIGRTPSVRWGARKIDIDILMIDDTLLETHDLTIPHIRIPERMFVLVPLSQIVSENWRHPVNGRSVREMINALDGQACPLKVCSFFG